MKIMNRYTGDCLLEIEDLRGADLREADLRGADLRRAGLSEAYLRGADLRRAGLRGADLRGAVLRGADLRGADLRGADLIVGGQRSDGYRFLAHHSDGKIFISAGCRYFKLDQARDHWIRTRGGTVLGEESLALIDHLEAMAKIAGWVQMEAEEKVR